jgi:hypothetical protein
MTERARCRRSLDEASGGLGYGCAGQDPSGRIESAIAKARSAVATACDVNDDGADMLTEINRLGACGDTPAQLQDCAISEVAVTGGSGLASIAYDLPADCRAGGVLRIVNASFGSQITDSDFSAGWAGVAHEIDLTDRFRDRLVLDCDADCASCAVSLDVDLQTTCADTPSRTWDLLSGSNCIVEGATPTTTSTSTTLLPSFDCAGAVFPPLCSLGTCPVGETCVTTGSTCACSP